MLAFKSKSKQITDEEKMQIVNNIVEKHFDIDKTPISNNFFIKEIFLCITSFVFDLISKHTVGMPKGIFNFLALISLLSAMTYMLLKFCKLVPSKGTYEGKSIADYDNYGAYANKVIKRFNLNNKLKDVIGSQQVDTYSRNLYNLIVLNLKLGRRAEVIQLIGKYNDLGEMATHLIEINKDDDFSHYDSIHCAYTLDLDFIMNLTDLQNSLYQIGEKNINNIIDKLIRSKNSKLLPPSVCDKFGINTNTSNKDLNIE